jgi:hypothetical protein
MVVSRARDASEFLLPAVTGAVAALDLEPEDEAMVKIARHYARVIDQAPASKEAYCARWILPELVKVLAELGASPAARVRMKGGKPVELDSPIRKLKSISL